MPNKTCCIYDFFLIKEWVQFPSYACDASKTDLLFQSIGTFLQIGAGTATEKITAWEFMFLLLLLGFFSVRNRLCKRPHRRWWNYLESSYLLLVVRLLPLCKMELGSENVQNESTKRLKPAVCDAWLVCPPMYTRKPHFSLSSSCCDAPRQTPHWPFTSYVSTDMTPPWFIVFVLDSDKM